MKFLQKLGELFLLPGNKVCDLLGVEGEENRLILRAFTNLFFYGIVAFSVVLMFFV